MQEVADFQNQFLQHSDCSLSHIFAILISSPPSKPLEAKNKELCIVAVFLSSHINDIVALIVATCVYYHTLFSKAFSKWGFSCFVFHIAYLILL